MDKVTAFNTSLISSTIKLLRHSSYISILYWI